MTLGEKERVVTTFYFYGGLTLREIGGALNLAEGRITQILHRALANAREAKRGPLGEPRAPRKALNAGMALYLEAPTP